MGARDLVLSMAFAPKKTVRDLRDRALSRLAGVVERRMAPREETAAFAEEMVERAPAVWAPSPTQLPGLNVRADRQLELLQRLQRVARNLPILGGPEMYTFHLMRTALSPQRVERTPGEVGPGDIFRAGRPTPRLLFETLPELPAGVWIELEETPYPFDQTRQLARAFLSFNDVFQIRLWPSYLHQHYRSQLEQIPSIAADRGSLWIRKVG